MMRAELTRFGLNANLRGMARWFLLAMAALPLAACVSVKAPEKPIEINLNINIKQEVVFALDSKAQDLIKRNPGIF